MRTETVRAAAIQMEATVADIKGNIAQACDLAEQAMRGGAEIVALPEFFTTSIVLDKRLHGCALPVENSAVEMLKALSHHHGAMIGGSYLEYEGGDIYNTYVLITPDGDVHRHRKDLPTMIENAYYIGGSDDGLVKLGKLNVGIAVCWETIRSASVQRLKGQCDLLMCGSHWWSTPDWKIIRPYMRHHERLNADHMFRAPGRFARMVGAPLLHAAHSGLLEGRYAFTSNLSVKMRTHLVGETQIVDANGSILARRRADEGVGIIFADVMLGRLAPIEPTPDSFWLEKLPPFVRALWITQNSVGKAIYARAKQQGKIIPFDETRNAPAKKRIDRVVPPQLPRQSDVSS